MLKIIAAVDAEEKSIALHGRLTTSEVAEMEEAAARVGLPLRLDLEHLTSVDADGLEALLRQERRGARLSHASPLIDLLLNRAADSAEGGGQ